MLAFKKIRIKNAIFFIILALWVCNWVLNLKRNFLSHLEESKNLFGKPLQEKWVYVFGKELYEFASACKKIIPANETVSFFHAPNIPKFNILFYFLYPRMASDDGNFIMVYKYPYEKKDAGKIIYMQADDIYILRK